MRLVHFADLHLGIENYGRIDPETGLHSRFQDYIRCLDFVIDHAIEHGADAVLCAGDVYRNANPNPTWQREFASRMKTLHNAGIPIVIVVGNHDIPAGFGRATSVDIFGALDLERTLIIREPGLHILQTPNGPLQVAGLPWPTRHFLRSNDQFYRLDQEQTNQKISAICKGQIEQFGREINREYPSILIAHATASEAIFSGSERSAMVGLDPTLLTSTLAHPAFDYVALGHIHRHQILNQNGKPPVVYSGSIERIDFGEISDIKGFCDVSIQGAEAGSTIPEIRTVAISFIPTPARRFISIEADARGQNATELLIESLEGSDISDAVVRVSCLCDVDQASSIDMTAVRKALQKAHYIAGILPKTIPKEKIRRVSISEETKMLDALNLYIDNNPSLSDKRETLRQYAENLERNFDPVEKSI